jgi:uncharacterized protein involved in high-affinity Fe2+ transport
METLVAEEQTQHPAERADSQANMPPSTKPRASRAAKPKQADAATQSDTAMAEQPAKTSRARATATSAAATPKATTSRNATPKRATTAASQPPMQPSNEATAEQLKLAKAQGDAYAKALQAMDKESGAQTQRAGDYEIAVVAERAEGMYHAGDGQLRWMEPEHDNVHFEVAVRDAADGRFIPGLHVRIHVDKVGGDHVGEGELPFIWHPWLFHYGQNWWVPGDGDYRVRVHVAPPTWHRHDKQNGNRYSQPADADFTVTVKTGQKRSE